MARIISKSKRRPPSALKTAIRIKFVSDCGTVQKTKLERKINKYSRQHTNSFLRKIITFNLVNTCTKYYTRIVSLRLLLTSQQKYVAPFIHLWIIMSWYDYLHVFHIFRLHMGLGRNNVQP